MLDPDDINADPQPCLQRPSLACLVVGNEVELEAVTGGGAAPHTAHTEDHILNRSCH
jgi:hypothetical protein